MNLDTLNILSGGEQLLSGFMNAFADISQSNFIAQQFQLNEQLAQVKAQEAMTAGNVEQQIQQQRTGQLGGQQQAAEAAQGVDVHTGTAAITRTQTGEIGGKDYLTIGNNAFLKGLGYQIEGANANTDAALEKASGTHRATSALLGGANDFYQSTLKAISYDQEAKQFAEMNH